MALQTVLFMTSLVEDTVENLGTLATPFINLPCFLSWVDSNILGKKGRCLILSCSHLSMWFELMGKMGSCQESRMWAPRQLWCRESSPRSIPQHAN